MKVPVVVNPRRRRKHHSYTAAQRRAGFAGRRAMTGRRRRRRRNPAMAAMNPGAHSSSNPRRRRYGYTPRRRRSYRSRYNPGLGGFLKGFDLTSAFGVTAGILTTRHAPGLIARVWPAVPQAGMTGLAVRAGSVIGISYLLRMLKQHKLAQGAMIGGLGYLLSQVIAEYVLPAVGGMTGLGANNRVVTQGELEAMGLQGYQVRTNGLEGYRPSTDVVDQVLQA